MKIYIAGPYTADTEEEIELNVQRAIDIGIEIILKGHIPYIPHLTHYIDKRAKEIGIALTWNDYMAIDLSWLRECDALLFMGSSKGANIELEIAKKLPKEIYFGIDKIKENSKHVQAIP